MSITARRTIAGLVLLFIFALVVQSAHAGFNYKTPDMRVVGYDEPCEATFSPAAINEFAAAGVDLTKAQRAEVTTANDAFRACWAPISEPGKVFIIDEHGGMGFLKVGEEV